MIQFVLPPVENISFLQSPAFLSDPYWLFDQLLTVNFKQPVLRSCFSRTKLQFYHLFVIIYLPCKSGQFEIKLKANVFVSFSNTKFLIRNNNLRFSPRQSLPFTAFRGLVRKTCKNNKSMQLLKQSRKSVISSILYEGIQSGDISLAKNKKL